MLQYVDLDNKSGTRTNMKRDTVLPIISDSAYLEQKPTKPRQSKKKRRKKMQRRKRTQRQDYSKLQEHELNES